MKLEYIVAYENSSDEFDIEHRRSRSRSLYVFKSFPSLPQYKLPGPITQGHCRPSKVSPFTTIVTW